MNCTKSALVELVIWINNLVSKFFWFVRFGELLTDGTIVLNTVLNQLIHTKVKHVVFDCEIWKCRINRQLFLVIHNNHSGAETIPQILNRRFERQVSLNLSWLESTIRCLFQCCDECTYFLLRRFCFAIKFFNSILRNFFDFILNFVATFDDFLFALTCNKEVWLPKLLQSKLEECWVWNTVEDICKLKIFLSIVTDLLKKSVIHFFFRNFAFEWLFFSS